GVACSGGRFARNGHVRRSKGPPYGVHPPEGPLMYHIALAMLFRDKAKFFGIIMGVTLASLVITQQGAIFTGLMARTFAAISDMGDPDIWVMDPKVQFIDDIKPLQDTALYRVRGVEGVTFAAPLYKGLIRARLDNGEFQNCI